MGFGYLLIGYLITFVIKATVSGLGFGGLALLVGYGVMLYGFMQLNLYHRAFAWSKWLLIPLMVTAVYDQLLSLDEMLLWGLPFVNDLTNLIFEWVTFVLLIVFHFAMLYAIRMIAGEVGLLHIATKSIRNMILMGLYAVLWVGYHLTLSNATEAAKYLSVPVLLLNVVWVVCNLLLLLSCNKNICRAGDEDQPVKRSRFEWINRIGDAYERNRQTAIDNTRREAEEVLRRRQEARRSKNSQRKKKK